MLFFPESRYNNYIHDKMNTVTCSIQYLFNIIIVNSKKHVLSALYNFILPR